MNHPSPLDPLQPWLSVIMPTFNGERFVRAALESIENQSAIPLEVIVVDDGSSDDTLEIVQSFSERLNLQVIQEGHVGNWVRNTNLGLKWARGKYVCFLHQDDLWLSGRVAKLFALSVEYPEAALLLHASFFIDPQGRRLGKWRCPFPKNSGLLHPDFIFERLVVQNFIAIPAPIWKREALASIGVLDEALWFTSDWKLWLKLAGFGPWAYLSEELSCFRLHPESQTITGARNLESFREQYDRVLAEFLPPESGRARLRSLAQFSSETNQFLAAAFHRSRPSCGQLLWNGLRLGPFGWYRFLHYSRIIERVSARLRVRLQDPQQSSRS